MIKLIIGLDILSVLFAIMALVVCLRLYTVVKEKGFLCLTIAIMWMVIIRIAWLLSSFFAENGGYRVKVVLGSMAVVHYVLLAIALYKIFKDVSKVLKK